ncbi:BlaI/MecI/CopY family transcriptional regulator [bacterium]|nr:BlaI/MecI/CopY family transcriptional regulator [bacterium]
MVCGSLEIEILNTFWHLASENEDVDISIQDVVDELAKNGCDRAYTTIKTVMDRLVTKSILVRYKSGKKFFYKATMDKREMALDMMREFTSNFFDGDIRAMVHFVEQEASEILVK